MTSKEKRAREIRRSIGEVLLRNWDPISVRGEPQARDEYDKYVGGVYKLTASGATVHELADHLARVEASISVFRSQIQRCSFPLLKNSSS
jgi:hypothetical protein